ncbi:MAG: adenine phosphoribosyltransferase [Myxococcota bacterium]
MNYRLDPDVADAHLTAVRDAIAAVPDFPKEGILFRDITPVLAQPTVLEKALALHLHAVADVVADIDVIVGIESRGFLFGMPLATMLGVGFVPVRKPGKLPRTVLEERYALEYGEDALQVHADDLAAGQKVLVVDDLLATGGTASAACALVERVGASVLGCLFLIELEALGGRAKLGEGRRIDAIIGY